MIKFFIKLVCYFTLSFYILTLESGNETLFNKLHRLSTPYKESFQIHSIIYLEKAKSFAQKILVDQK